MRAGDARELPSRPPAGSVPSGWTLAPDHPNHHQLDGLEGRWLKGWLGCQSL
jgi:hypothetical protein